MNERSFHSSWFLIRYTWCLLMAPCSYAFVLSRSVGFGTPRVVGWSSVAADFQGEASFVHDSSKQRWQIHSPWEPTVEIWNTPTVNSGVVCSDKFFVVRETRLVPERMTLFEVLSDVRRAIPKSRKLLEWYLRCVEKSPLVTKSLTAALVGSIGDILSQWIRTTTHGIAFTLDVRRLSTLFLCGLCFIGPFYHMLYGQLWKLGSWMEYRWKSSTQMQTLAQIFVDQTIGIFLYFSSYYYVYELMESIVCQRALNFVMATQSTRTTMLRVLAANLYVWPLTNYINFSYVPEKLHVLVTNMVEVIWNIYFCTVMAG